MEGEVFNADSNFLDYGDYDEEGNHQNFWAQDLEQCADLEGAGGRSDLLEWIRGRRRAFIRYSQDFKQELQEVEISSMDMMSGSPWDYLAMVA